MQETLFREYCRQHHCDAATTEAAVQAVREFEEDTAAGGQTLAAVTQGHLADYLARLLRDGKITEGRLLALARYTYITHRNDLFIMLALTIEAPGILPALRERAHAILGDAAAEDIFRGLELPPAGSPLAAYPAVTAEILQRLQTHLPPETCREVLTGNLHRIPVEQFQEMARQFRARPDIDAFLEDRHVQLVHELEDHLRQGTLWYEQEITSEVLAFVRGNREIQSGVRHGGTIHVTKIPFAPQAYLHARDPAMQRYYACHCPLVRSSILTGEPAVSPLLCRCSAGYEKLIFDVVFGEPVEVEVLESALGGSTRCRFAIAIPERLQASCPK